MGQADAMEVCQLADADATHALGRRLAERLLARWLGGKRGAATDGGSGRVPEVLKEATGPAAGARERRSEAAPPLLATPPLLLLQGDLGAGKTCLVQGLAEGLAIPEPVTSPSFALAQHYAGTAADGRATRLVHLDLYRLEQPAAADELFSQEEEEARIAAVSTRVVMAVEWPERLSFQPEGAWLLRLEHRGDGRRASWRAT